MRNRNTEHFSAFQGVFYATEAHDIDIISKYFISIGYSFGLLSMTKEKSDLQRAKST